MSRRVSHKEIRQLTIRGFGPELERRIRDLAAREDLSLNQAALRLMRRGAGLTNARPQPDRVGDGLDQLAGTWTKEEADEFNRYIEEAFEKIDPEMWA